MGGGVGGTDQLFQVGTWLWFPGWSNLREAFLSPVEERQVHTSGPVAAVCGATWCLHTFCPMCKHNHVASSSGDANVAYSDQSIPCAVGVCVSSVV